jgi:hypothetical protein
MYMYIYVYIYIYTCLYIHVYTYFYMYVYMVVKLEFYIQIDKCLHTKSTQHTGKYFLKVLLQYLNDFRDFELSYHGFIRIVALSNTEIYFTVSTWFS